MASPAYIVEHEFTPDDVVYVINACENSNSAAHIIRGTVIRVRIDIIVNKTTITYDIRMDSNGTTAFEVDNVFASKELALAEYSTRI